MSRRKKGPRPPVPDVVHPSPDEVQQMCLEIQSHWSARDRRRRTVATPATWTAPTIRCADITRERSAHWALAFR